MIPLSSRIDDTGFDALLALARRRLPALAPQWTDYNYHDPGIMLLELLSWVADSQIYSLGRNRLDERLAMALLLGGRPAGAIAARGVLYPIEPSSAVQTVKRDAVLKSARDSAPRMEVASKINVLPVAVRKLETRESGGNRTDHSAANMRPRAPFVPFGDKGTGELSIELKKVGDLPTDEKQLVRLSLGVELDPKSASGEPPAGVCAPIEIVDENGKPLLVRDTTQGLQRNGVLILCIPVGQLTKPIIIRPKGGYPLRPKLLQIMPNALPVEQRASFQPDGRGNNRPGQQVVLTPATLFDPDEPVEGHTWRLVDGESSLCITSSDGSQTFKWKRGRLDEAGPDDLRYSLDERADGSRLAIRFGNGLNGSKPGLDDRIVASLRLSCGRQGNVRKPVEWVLAPQGTRWRNVSGIRGGRDAQTVKQAISEADAAMRDKRVLTTTKELLRALAPLKALLRIDRAEVEEGWEPGLKRPRIAGTRTLIVGHEQQGAETAAWLRTIRRSLTGQIAVGERLIVTPPKYVPFELAVDVEAAPGCDPATVRKAIADELKKRFRPKPTPWPLGRDVDATAVAGWVRAVEGVGGSVTVRITSDGERKDTLPIGRGTLPKFFEPVPKNIVVRESGR